MGIIGPSGAGKSCLGRVLVGIWPPRRRPASRSATTTSRNCEFEARAWSPHRLHGRRSMTNLLPTARSRKTSRGLTRPRKPIRRKNHRGLGTHAGIQDLDPVAAGRLQHQGRSRRSMYCPADSATGSRSRAPSMARHPSSSLMNRTPISMRARSSASSRWCRSCGRCASSVVIVDPAAIATPRDDKAILNAKSCRAFASGWIDRQPRITASGDVRPGDWSWMPKRPWRLAWKPFPLPMTAPSASTADSAGECCAGIAGRTPSPRRLSVGFIGSPQ